MLGHREEARVASVGWEGLYGKTHDQRGNGEGSLQKALWSIFRTAVSTEQRMEPLASSEQGGDLIWLTFEKLTRHAMLITHLGGKSRSKRSGWEAIAVKEVRSDGELRPGGVVLKEN